jgi:hypothetical protein
LQKILVSLYVMKEYLVSFLFSLYSIIRPSKFILLLNVSICSALSYSMFINFIAVFYVVPRKGDQQGMDAEKVHWIVVSL